MKKHVRNAYVYIMKNGEAVMMREGDDSETWKWGLTRKMGMVERGGEGGINFEVVIRLFN